ncbi:MAG: ATP-dependent DNA helicase, partial [Candidatus Altiarchaeota archaeon]|nr:ATP-dependent DNA helicase [Candidatus Altiarchaeota archaeon]
MAGLFPFKRVRGGQREFMDDVSQVLKEKKHLIAHAPTGIGKTVAALAPTLELALEKNKTIFFLTPKHTQHVIVIDTLKRIRKKHGIDFVAVDIVGKQWTCPHQVRDLNSREFNQFCRKLKKDERCTYYNKVRKGKLSEKAARVVGEIKKNIFHSEEISDKCAGYGMCPYEICVEVGKDANIIICDYFHIFSPKVRKAFLSKLKKNLENSILVVDEAHNLPERVRSLLSNNLTEKQLSRAIKEAHFTGYEEKADDYGELQSILKQLGQGVKRGGERLVGKDEFISLLEEKLDTGYEEFMEEVKDLGERVLELPNRHKSYSRSIARFLENWIGEDLGYVRILSRENHYRLSYRCLDPSISSSEIFSRSCSSVLMSGTLLPQEMYADIMGFNLKNTLLREYRSPFPQENKVSIIVPNVTTRYSKRSDYMFRKYAAIISQTASLVPGNVAVFFPAYHLMDKVGGLVDEKLVGKRVFVERRGMGKEDRMNLHSQLINLMGSGGGLLMGVQAGSFSEGMDYANNLLDAVIVVGLPLETPNLEVKSLIEYYDFRFGRGWDYGYVYPAMNRALQAAGRCIRTEKDRGIIVFMDERFRWRNYSKCFPQEFDLIVSETPQR